MLHLISVDLPEGVIVTGEITTLSFIDAEGVERWDCRIGTQMTQSQIVGLLEMAQHEFLSARDDRA